MKTSKLIRHLETKHSNRATRSYIILPTPWSKYETSETYLAGCFYQEDKHHMKSHLKLPSKKHTTGKKNACKTYLLEAVKLLLGKTSKANTRRISLCSEIDQRRTSDLPEDVKDQVITEMKTSQFQCFLWMSQLMLLHVLSCLFSWLVIIRKTLSSCFVRNCTLQQVQDVREKEKYFDSAKLPWKYSYDCYSSVKCAGFHDKN